MKAKRKRHSGAFKAKVGFEALVGLKTVAQLAREYSTSDAGDAMEGDDSGPAAGVV